MDLRDRKLGILLAAGPGQPGFRHGLGLARAALKRGLVVHLFCIHEGVRGVEDEQVQALRSDGARVHACALSARRLGVPLGEGATPAGLALASNLAAKVDRLLAFT